MTATFTRDSVCAGDDGDAPHSQRLACPPGCTADQLVRHVMTAARLPSIIGGAATWCLSSRKPVAVLAQQWAEPRVLGLMPLKFADLDADETTVRLHFSYFAQQDPQVVFDVLGRLRLFSP